MTGCRVILAVRSQQKGEEAALKIKTSTGSNKVEVMVLDLSSVGSTRAFAEEFIKKQLPLHVLIHNAGASSETVRFNKEGLEENMALNFINVVLLTSLLLSTMRKTVPAARIVLVGSSAHFQGKRDIALSLADVKVPITGWVLYGSSKLNLVAYGHALGAILSKNDDTVSVCSMDPGFVATPFYTKELPFPISVFAKASNAFAKTPAQGAHTHLFAALNDEPMPNGVYLADTLISTSSSVARDTHFQEMLMKNTVSKLKDVAPWWDGKWY
jgi:NAD(P)-dependent dehydrogenase (short-subunit alcohol dehydrogenase family)